MIAFALFLPLSCVGGTRVNCRYFYTGRHIYFWQCSWSQKFFTVLSFNNVILCCWIYFVSVYIDALFAYPYLPFRRPYNNLFLYVLCNRKQHDPGQPVHIRQHEPAVAAVRSTDPEQTRQEQGLRRCREPHQSWGQGLCLDLERRSEPEMVVPGCDPEWSSTQREACCHSAGRPGIPTTPWYGTSVPWVFTAASPSPGVPTPATGQFGVLIAWLGQTF